MSENSRHISQTVQVLKKVFFFILFWCEAIVGNFLYCSIFSCGVAHEVIVKVDVQIVARVSLIVSSQKALQQSAASSSKGGSKQSAEVSSISQVVVATGVGAQ